MFWIENKPEKTKKWLEKAVYLNKDNGDAWIHLYKFEKEFGTGESLTQVIKQIKEADPRHGDIW